MNTGVRLRSVPLARSVEEKSFAAHCMFLYGRSVRKIVYLSDDYCSK
jgi:hypothetical protein